MKEEYRAVLYYSYRDAVNLPISYIGGKAYNLVKLFQNGIAVPLGIIIPAIYSEYHYQFNYSNVLDYLKNEINIESYAVRSSAVGEDSHQLSWAGCFETSLDVNLSDIPNKIISCQESVQCERAVAYARLHKVTPLSLMGVLIQEYIKADYHGVIFSVNPITNSKSEYVVEFQKGESGMVVEGVGVPTIITVSKNDKTTKFLASQQLFIDANIINLLTNVAQKIESIINDYADIEWVISNNNLIITQARAITTLQ